MMTVSPFIAFPAISAGTWKVIDLPPPGRENSQQRPVADGGVHSPFLERFPVVGPVAVVSEKPLEPFLAVQLIVAVAASFKAWDAAQLMHHPVHTRIVPKDPGRCDGVVVVRIDQRQTVGQLDRMTDDHPCQVRMAAEPVIEVTLDFIFYIE